MLIYKYKRERSLTRELVTNVVNEYLFPKWYKICERSILLLHIKAKWIIMV